MVGDKEKIPEALRSRKSHAAEDQDSGWHWATSHQPRMPHANKNCLQNVEWRWFPNEIYTASQAVNQESKNWTSHMQFSRKLLACILQLKEDSKPSRRMASDPSTKEEVWERGYGVSWDNGGEKFQNIYHGISKKVKARRWRVSRKPNKIKNQKAEVISYQMNLIVLLGI